MIADLKEDEETIDNQEKEIQQLKEKLGQEEEQEEGKRSSLSSRKSVTLFLT